MSARPYIGVTGFMSRAEEPAILAAVAIALDCDLADVRRAGMTPLPEGAPPAWLLAAVEAALPPSGEVRGFNAIEHAVNLARGAQAMPFRAEMDSALAHLVSAGTIEPGPEGTWRRWGVPEGWEWRPIGSPTLSVRDEFLLRIGETRRNSYLACAYGSGSWQAFNPYQRGETEGKTIASAKTAALRACWERGVFAPTLTLSTPPANPMGEQARIAAAVTGEGIPRCPQCRAVHPYSHKPDCSDGRPLVPYASRAAHLRNVLLDALTPMDGDEPERVDYDDLRTALRDGGIEGAEVDEIHAALRAIGARSEGPGWRLPTDRAPAPRDRLSLLRDALLDTFGTAGAVVPLSWLLEACDDAGATGATLAELRPVLASVGARADGPRWSLRPVEELGWGWCRVATRLYLTPLGSERVSDAIVSLGPEGRSWLVTVPGHVDREVAQGETDGEEESKRESVEVARRYGLLTPPPATAAEPPPPAPEPWEEPDAIERVALMLSGDDKPTLGEATVALREMARGIVERVERRAAERAGPTVPHAEVVARLAQRAYAADAPLLFAVWQAATALVEADDAYQRTIDAADMRREADAYEARGAAIDKLRTLLDAAEQRPERPTHPHQDGNEEPWETIERLARLLAETQAAAKRDEARAEAERVVLMRERDGAQRGAAALRYEIAGLRTQVERARKREAEIEAEALAVAAERDAAQRERDALLGEAHDMLNRWMARKGAP